MLTSFKRSLTKEKKSILAIKLSFLSLSKTLKNGFFIINNHNFFTLYSSCRKFYSIPSSFSFSPSSFLVQTSFVLFCFNFYSWTLHSLVVIFGFFYGVAKSRTWAVKHSTLAIYSMIPVFYYVLFREGRLTLIYTQYEEHRLLKQINVNSNPYYATY